MAEQIIDFGDFPDDPDSGTVRAAFEKSKENFSELYTNKLSGTQASDIETQISAPVTEDFKYISRSKLYNWWVWAKTQAITFSGSLKLSFLTGTGERVLTVNSTNDVAGTYLLRSPYVTDVAIVTAITAADFSVNNPVSITPAGGVIMRRGDMYFVAKTSSTNGYWYYAVSDNFVSRTLLS